MSHYGPKEKYINRLQILSLKEGSLLNIDMSHSDCVFIKG